MTALYKQQDILVEHYEIADTQQILNDNIGNFIFFTFYIYMQYMYTYD
jgi:hypothetical protein